MDMPTVYHLFLARVGGQSYRCSTPLDDAGFDGLMDVLHWKMPYNLRAFHCSDPGQIERNPVLKGLSELSTPLDLLLSSRPVQTMRLKDKRRGETLTVRSKYGDYVIAETEDGYGRLYCVDGKASSLITRLEAVPITLQEASAYVDKHHRHNAGPKFHKYSICLCTPNEAEPVGVAVASIPKSRHQMDSETLEINRCCTDARYDNVCSSLYARVIRIGREMGYRRFLTYTLPGESGSSLKAVGFQIDGIVAPSSNGWNVSSRPRNTEQYPKGEKLRWVYHIS